MKHKMIVATTTTTMMGMGMSGFIPPLLRGM